MSARPVGALEITETGTRFIPFVDPARLGIALIVGFLIGLTVGRGPAQRSFRRCRNSLSPRLSIPQGDAFKQGFLDFPGGKLPRDRSAPHQGRPEVRIRFLQRRVIDEPYHSEAPITMRKSVSLPAITFTESAGN